MKKISKRKISLSIIAFILVISTVFLLYGNFYVDIQRIDIKTGKLPVSFNNYLIAHISDYHNRSSFLVDKQIINSLQKEQPDIIVITGDLIDCNKTDVQTALEFVSKVKEIAPVYFVAGNHEANIASSNFSDFCNLINGLEELGVTFLRNDFVKISNEAGDSFNLYGIHDPYFYGGYEQVYQRTEALCDELDMNIDEFNVLLAHHPETVSVYKKFKVNVVFSGHAHGGQITLFGTPVVAPDQKIFPPYTEGLYETGVTRLIVSRGIGYSNFPLRVFCNPHLVYAEFKSTQ